MVDGKYVPEELICKITPQGLVVIVNNFSPFSVVAMEKDPNAPSQKEKTITISSETLGGNIFYKSGTEDVGASGLYSFEKDQASKTFVAKADQH